MELSKQKENLLLSRRGFKQLNSNKFGSSRVPSTCSFTKKRKFVNRTASSFQPKVKKKVVEVKRIERKNSITNFFTKKPGMYVNFEVDMMARTLDRLLAAQNQ